MTSRTDIANALLTFLSSQYPFTLISRRNRNPQHIGTAECPALFLVESKDTYQRQSPSMSPKRTMQFLALLYSDVGADDNAIPNDTINAILDAFDSAMDTEQRQDGMGLFELNGLTYACYINGDVERASGETSGLALAVCPITVLLP